MSSIFHAISVISKAISRNRRPCYNNFMSQTAICRITKNPSRFPTKKLISAKNSACRYRQLHRKSVCERSWQHATSGSFIAANVTQQGRKSSVLTRRTALLKSITIQLGGEILGMRFLLEEILILTDHFLNNSQSFKK